MAHRTPVRRQVALALDDGIPGKVTPVALILHEKLSFKRWIECGGLLGRISRSVQFWVGDWILYGEDHFGEKFSQALDETGNDPKTLLNWVRVVKAVAPERRRETLSFAHHDAVSGLSPEDQSYWLQRAEEGDTLPSGEKELWSSRRLRAEIKKLTETPAPVDIEVEVEDKEKVPLDYLVVDIEAVRAAYKAGTTEIAGLKLIPPKSE